MFSSNIAKEMKLEEWNQALEMIEEVSSQSHGGKIVLKCC
jgi:hypothetical protein